MDLVTIWIKVIIHWHWFIHSFIRLPDGIYAEIKSWIQILANPIAIIIATGFFNYKLAKDKEDRESKLAEEKETKEKEKEEENKRLAEEEKKRQLEDKRQAIITDYLKQMTTLLTEYQLCNATHDNPAARVARALTLNTIRELDSGRNQLLTNFLFEAKLIQGGASEDDNNLPSLLKDSKLNGVNLEEANLNDANLHNAILYDSNLEGASIVNAYLKKVNFNNANLINSYLMDTCLEEANLNGANLYGANLINSNLYGANLYGANLIDANLKNANLKNAFLEGVNFKDVKVNNARFGNNEGIDEDMKADLMSRGAIFED